MLTYLFLSTFAIRSIWFYFSMDYYFNIYDDFFFFLRGLANEWWIFVPRQNTNHYSWFLYLNIIAAAGDGLLYL